MTNDHVVRQRQLVYQPDGGLAQRVRGRLLVLPAQSIQSVFKNDLLALRGAERRHDITNRFGSRQAYARSVVLKYVSHPQIRNSHDKLLVAEKMLATRISVRRRLRHLGLYVTCQGKGTNLLRAHLVRESELDGMAWPSGVPLAGVQCPRKSYQTRALKKALLQLDDT